METGRSVLYNIFLISIIVFTFGIILGLVWYSDAMFGKTWISTITNRKDMDLGPLLWIFSKSVMLLGLLMFSIITVNIFAIYIHNSDKKEDSIFKQIFYSIVRLPFLLTAFYFAVNIPDVAFNIYKIKHLVIDTGYIFLLLCFSCISVIVLFEDKNRGRKDKLDNT